MHGNVHGGGWSRLERVQSLWQLVLPQESMPRCPEATWASLQVIACSECEKWCVCNVKETTYWVIKPSETQNLKLNSCKYTKLFPPTSFKIKCRPVHTKIWWEWWRLSTNTSNSKESVSESAKIDDTRANIQVTNFDTKQFAPTARACSEPLI